jgi:DNA-binding CsgD family transcriptional regulator/tetratricopeptide (TPR) repeat protein
MTDQLAQKSTHGLSRTRRAPAASGLVVTDGAGARKGPDQNDRSIADRLVGRRDELQRLRAFLHRACSGGTAHLISGDHGVGKSALLAATAEEAEELGMRVLRARGVEFEAGVSYSGLNQALLPVRTEFDRLGPVYREALSTALGLDIGPSAGRLVVFNATLSLLHAVSADQPVLITVDDVCWLDKASAVVLGFVARRLPGSRIGLLAASRTGTQSFFETSGLTEMVIPALNAEAAARLVDVHFPDLAPRVRRRILAEALGNPLALLEFGAALRGCHRAAVPELAPVLPLGGRLEALFAERAVDLPTSTRRLLLLAAFDGTGDLRVLKDACGQGDLNDLCPAERAQLIRVDESSGRLTFRHPLTRSALVASSTHEERREAHRALASALLDEPERRAWHLAEATGEPDEQVAALLEEAAHRILHRGDAIGAVEALTRAAALSPSSVDKGRRLAEAAYIAAEQIGDSRGAEALLDKAQRADPTSTGSLHAVTAAVNLLLNRDGDVATAYRLLVAAIETEPHGYSTDNSGLIEAMHTLFLVCWFGGRPEMWDRFDVALRRMKPQPPGVLSIASKTFADPVRTAAATLDELQVALASLPGEPDPTRIVRLGTASIYVDRLAESREFSRRLVVRGRAGASTRRYLGSLLLLCLDYFISGQWEECQKLADEGLTVCDAHGYGFYSWYFAYHKAILAAVRGDDRISRQLADQITRWAAPRGFRCAEVFAHHPRVLAALSRNDFDGAYRHAVAISPAGTFASHVPHALWVAFDLVEAAVRTNRHAQAVAHVVAMTEANIAAISPRMALIQAGSSALVAADRDAQERFERALSTPNAARWPFELARIRLAYGERLRRMRATAKARTHLTAALEEFDRLGATPWALRASGELRATGRAIPAGEPTAVCLTAQEREIPSLAATGLTNKQIGARLYLSPRTVSAHLYHIFPKLGITSRAALRDALGFAVTDRPHSENGQL